MMGTRRPEEATDGAHRQPDTRTYPGTEHGRAEHGGSPVVPVSAARADAAVRSTRAVFAIAVGVAALLTVATSPASARRAPFAVTSPAFAPGGLIPEGFTCNGANASFPLRWRGVPKRTEELALIMEDPDAPIGTFVHWVAWGIDPGARRLPEETLPAGVVEGASGTGKPGYLGPCPPPADGAHRYRITMYGLDAPPDVAAGTATAADLRAAIKGHVLAKAKLVGRYDR